MDQILEILGKIGFDPKMALFNFINFLIVFWLLKKFVLVKLADTLTKRQEQIQDSIDSFDKAEEELNKAKENANAIIDEAKVQKDEILENTHKQAKEMSEKLKAESQGEINVLMENAEKKMDLDKEAMKNELRKETVDLVVESTEKILRQKLDSDTDKKVVDDLLNNIN